MLTFAVSECFVRGERCGGTYSVNIHTEKHITVISRTDAMHAHC